MAPTDKQTTQTDSAPVPAIRRTEDGLFVHYGFQHDGAFHIVASERAGDYDERVKAAKDEGE